MRLLAAAVTSLLLTAFVVALWPQAPHEFDPSSAGIYVAAAVDGVPAEARRERGPRESWAKGRGAFIAAHREALAWIAIGHAAERRRTEDRRTGLRQTLGRLRIPRMNDEPPGYRA